MVCFQGIDFGRILHHDIQNLVHTRVRHSNHRYSPGVLGIQNSGSHRLVRIDISLVDRLAWRSTDRLFGMVSEAGKSHLDMRVHWDILRPLNTVSQVPLTDLGKPQRTGLEKWLSLTWFETVDDIGSKHLDRRLCLNHCDLDLSCNHDHSIKIRLLNAHLGRDDKRVLLVDGRLFSDHLCLQLVPLKIVSFLDQTEVLKCLGCRCLPLGLVSRYHH